ncbi:MAG: hypothetical protein AAF604_20480 [Acidobacteriota bacterium]
MARVLTSFVLAMGCVMPLAAEDGTDYPCSPDVSYLGCLDQQLAALEKELNGAEQALKNDNDEENADLPTGLGDASSLRSFLPRFLADLGFENIDDSMGGLSFAYNFGETSPFSFSGNLREGEVWGPLAMTLPEDGRDDLVAALAKDIGDFDDARFELTYNFVSQKKGKVGRFESALEKRRKDTLDGIFDRVIEGTLEEVGTKRRNFASLFTGDLSMRLTPEDIPERADEFNAAFVAMVQELDTTERLIATTLGKAEDMLSNQPQRYLSASYDLRADGAGPSAWGLQLNWEIGLANLNSLERACGSSIESADCLDFLKRPDRVERGHRFKLTASYEDIEEFRFVDDEREIDFSSPAAEKLTAALTYGCKLLLSNNAEWQPRFDLEGRYEDISDNPEINDRWVVTATLRQKLSAEWTAKASIVWASDPEFRGEVDEEFSARAGISFEIDRPGDGTGKSK